MKELLQTFGYTLAIGVMVFFAVMIISRSSTGFFDKWKENNSNRLEEEAKRVVEGVDKSVGKMKDFTDRVMDRPRKTTSTPVTTPSVEEKDEGEHYTNNQEDNTNPYEDNTDVDSYEPSEETPMVDNKPDEYVTPTLTPTNNQRTVADVEDDDKTYEIQVGVVSDKNANIDNFKIIEDLGDIYAETIGNNKNRILLGEFYGKRAAQLVLSEVKRRGMKDAFLMAQKENPIAAVAPKNTTEKPATFATVEEKTGNFVVRLGVFSEPPTEKLTQLSEIGKIYLQAHPTNPNLNVVSLGIFGLKSQAESALTAAKKQNFKDAFVTTANNQLVDADAGKGLYYLPDEYKTAPANACTEQYVIQLSAAKRPHLGDFKALLNMGNLFTEYDPTKDVSKVFVGPFDDKAIAAKALQQVKSKGFSQAFIVDRTKY